MAAPTLSVRGTPAGIKLREGFSTKISFLYNLTVSFWEESVKPGGIDGGDPIPTTTMHNSAVHTFRPRTLKKYDPISGSASYDPNVISQAMDLINRETSITIRYPDGSTLVFYGYLKKIEFTELKEGEEPKLNYEIIVTNWDPTNNVEVAPVYTNVTGT